MRTLGRRSVSPAPDEGRWQGVCGGVVGGPAGNEGVGTIEQGLPRGIEAVFQVEESEILVEALPNRGDRRSLLFYEASEGGAGVLTRLATNEGALARVATAALEIMHFQNVPAAAARSEPLEDDPHS